MSRSSLPTMEANEGAQHHWSEKSYRLAVKGQELMKMIKTLTSLMSLTLQRVGKLFSAIQ